MKRLYVFIAVALLIFLSGCGEDCHECPDINETDVDPPYIESITGPGELLVDEEGDFSCVAVSDTEIVRYSWNVLPTSSHEAEYYFPSDTVEGPWTPGGTRPDLFYEDYSGASVSASYTHRGNYAAVVEIEDADAYKKRVGTIVRVNPIEPDAPEDTVDIIPGVADTISGTEFEMLSFGLWSCGGSPAATYADSWDTLHGFGYTSGQDGPGEKHVYSWAETGKIVHIRGSEYTDADIIATFYIRGVMHIWDAATTDYARISVYVMIRQLDGLPEMHHIYTHTLEGAGGDQSYYFNSEQEATAMAVLENVKYEFWFGVEMEQVCSGDGGSAICFDDEDGYIFLDNVIISFEK